MYNHFHQCTGYSLFTEISAVKDEADLLLPVFDDLVDIDHEGELGHIRDGPGVFFIEERHTVGLVHRDRQVKDRKAFFVLGSILTDRTFNDILRLFNKLCVVTVIALTILAIILAIIDWKKNHECIL